MDAWARLQNIAKRIPYQFLLQSVRNIHQFSLKRPAIYSQREELREAVNKPKTIRKALDFRKSSVVNAAHLARKKDYYAILGVRKSAGYSEIKKAYYLLAKKFHPDARQGSAAADAKIFQEISEAYHVLSDENKRMEYDLHGTVKDVGSYLHTLTVLGSKNEITDNGRKNRDRHTEESRSVPEDVDLPITFLQSVQGVRKEIPVKTTSPCKCCNGLRSWQQKTLEICRVCNGTGRHIAATSRSVVKTPCKACRGGRYTSRKNCSLCNNTGYTTNMVNVTVEVPAGINCGDIIKIAHPDRKNSINVRMKVTKNKHYNRMGNDIITEKYLTISEAILGGVFKIRGIYEEFEVKIPEGTESHTPVRIPRKGVKTSTHVGDHVVIIKIRIPKNLTAKQKEALAILTKIESSSRASSDSIRFIQ